MGARDTLPDRAALRRQYHGPILRAISLQARCFDPRTGRLERYAPATWKLLLAELFVDPVFIEARDPDTGEIDLVEQRSTEALTDDEFRRFLYEVQAFAVDDLKVTFPEQEGG